MSPNRKPGFTAKISTPAPEGIGVELDDFVACTRRLAGL